jgi:hypothetical protein
MKDLGLAGKTMPKAIMPLPPSHVFAGTQNAPTMQGFLQNREN